MHGETIVEHPLRGNPKEGPFPSRPYLCKPLPYHHHHTLVKHSLGKDRIPVPATHLCRQISSPSTAWQ